MINELQELDDTAVGSPSWMRHYQQIANDSLALVADLARTKWLEAPELANEDRAAIAAAAKLAALMAVDVGFAGSASRFALQTGDDPSRV